MQNGARYRAVWEILEQVFANQQPADKIINDYVRARRYIGAKDRRFIVELVWKIVRNRMKLSFDAKRSDGRGVLLYAMRDNLAEVFDGSQYGMQPLSKEEQNWLSRENDEPYPDYVEAECPKWLFDKIKDVDFCKALNLPASTDVRAHGLGRDELQKKLAKEEIEARFGVYAPSCRKIDGHLGLNNCMAGQDGEMAIQEEASQMVSLLTDVKAEHKIIDYCCGAGGKALAMSDILHNKGKILVHDVDSKRLAAIKPRIDRLKVKNIEIIDKLAESDKDFDRFILDAPCSGSGTWRRSPDAKFRLSEQKLASLVKTQAELLDLAAQKTKVGGRIVYITCSVLREENEDQIQVFLAKHKNFAPINLKLLWQQKTKALYPWKDEFCLRMSPFECGTDGFFVCVLERKF